MTRPETSNPSTSVRVLTPMQGATRFEPVDAEIHTGGARAVPCVVHLGFQSQPAGNCTNAAIMLHLNSLLNVTANRVRLLQVRLWLWKGLSHMCNLFLHRIYLLRL
jgi:hypothetical protein